MNEVTLLRQSYQLIRRDLGLEEHLEFDDTENQFDRLEDFLTLQVNHLLDHDLNRLLNAMYRIDIPEQKVQQLLNYSNQGEIARNLAKAIIEREKEKAITRQQYRPS